MVEYKTCGLDYIRLKSGYVNVSAGISISHRVKNTDGLHRAIAGSLVQASHPLSGAEFRFLRNQLNFSQNSLGFLMGVTSQAVAKWEKGAGVVPVLADKAIRDLYAENTGGQPVFGLLQLLSEADRKDYRAELTFEFNESDRGWLPATS